MGNKNSNHKYIREIQVKFRKKRVSDDSPVNRPILDPEDLVEIFRGMQDESKEKLVVVSLDSQLKILAFEIVCIGGLNVVHAKKAEIVRTPIILQAHRMVLIHNHPAGDPTPSDDDKSNTQSLVSFCDELGIPLVDHIIIGDGNYFSFAEQGLIEE